MIAIPELYKLNNEKLTFHLHPGQARAWRSDARFTFIIAGTQSGKTSFLPLWLNREISRAGHGDYLAATATYDLFKLKFLPEMRHFFVEMLHWQEDKSDRVFWRAYKPKMFDRIILRSASSEGGLESATVRGAVLDECGQDDFRITAWEAVQRRLSLSQGRVLGGTTPYNLGWLKQEVFDKWKGGDPSLRVIQFSSIMNPIFPPAEYERARATLPGWKFEMFYNGVFTRPAGWIYEDFSADENTCQPFDIPANWPRRVGIDFGGVHTSTVWLAENPTTETLYLYRETLEGGLTTKEHAAKWKRYGEHVVLWTGGAPSEDQPRRDFTAEGVAIKRPVIADVESGIDKVVEILKSRRLVIFKTCTGILDEMGIYSRELDDHGQPTDKIKDKDTFHRLDALRYVAIGIQRTVRKQARGWQG